MSTFRRNGRVLWLAYAAFALCVLVAGLFYAGERGQASALDALAEDASTDAELKRALLLTALDRSRTLPLVLAGDAKLAEALQAPNSEGIADLNEKLEALISGTGASVIYVIGLDGTAIAASNFRQPDSFVGSNYAFREYFTGAVAKGTAEQYALGTICRAALKTAPDGLWELSSSRLSSMRSNKTGSAPAASPM
jgi:two-component system C4-dicarboxylate transport sensor histidine kinase DctB